MSITNERTNEDGVSEGQRRTACELEGGAVLMKQASINKASERVPNGGKTKSAQLANN